MSRNRTSINPRCPYCGVRHREVKQERCRELAEEAAAQPERDGGAHPAYGPWCHCGGDDLGHFHRDLSAS